MCKDAQHVHNLWHDIPAEVELLPAKKASKAQKKREKEEHERQIRERELARVSESASQPESADDFERLVMGEPNSSMVWIQYMAFLISLGEIEKARGIAERGLATINYRQVQTALVAFCRQLRTCTQARPLHWVCIPSACSIVGPKHLIVHFCGYHTRFYNLDFISVYIIADDVVVAARGVAVTAFTVFINFLVNVILASCIHPQS